MSHKDKNYTKSKALLTSFKKDKSSLFTADKVYKNLKIYYPSPKGTGSLEGNRPSMMTAEVNLDLKGNKRKFSTFCRVLAKKKSYPVISSTDLVI